MLTVLPSRASLTPGEIRRDLPKADGALERSLGRVLTDEDLRELARVLEHEVARQEREPLSGPGMPGSVGAVDRR